MVNLTKAGICTDGKTIIAGMLQSCVLVCQWCSNRGPQGPLEWPVKQFSLERKL